MIQTTKKKIYIKLSARLDFYFIFVSNKKKKNTPAINSSLRRFEFNKMV